MIKMNYVKAYEQAIATHKANIKELEEELGMTEGAEERAFIIDIIDQELFSQRINEQARDFRIRKLKLHGRI